jgi:RNase P/RNase MRP subunit p29
MALVRRRVGDGARLLRIEGLKFKSPILPRQRVVLTLRGGSAATSFGFQIADGSRVLAQGKVVVARPERGGT